MNTVDDLSVTDAAESSSTRAPKPRETGQSPSLAYLAATHDETVFDQPFRFPVGRSPLLPVGTIDPP